LDNLGKQVQGTFSKFYNIYTGGDKKNGPNWLGLSVIKQNNKKKQQQ
jgi:hypothetical protein